MAMETLNIYMDARRAYGKYPAPLEQLDGGYVTCSLDIPPPHSEALIDISEQYGNAKVFSVASNAVLLGSIVLLGARYNVRPYVFDEQGMAHELPLRPQPFDTVSVYETNRVRLKLLYRAWSLQQMLEIEQGISGGALLAYGMDITERLRNNLVLKSVNSLGRPVIAATLRPETAD
jgi:hypothetical protein